MTYLGMHLHQHDQGITLDQIQAISDFLNAAPIDLNTATTGLCPRCAR